MKLLVKLVNSHNLNHTAQ